jgi:site-specific DNA recombinase
MKPVVLYARVSSKEQQEEGFSIPAQLKLLHEYVRKNDFRIVQEFVDIETAKKTGRKHFGEMVRFLKTNPQCRTIIVEKTDRLYRNFADFVILEDMEIEIHLPKEGQVVSKEARSQDKLLHNIQLVFAKNYIENLREEVKKGMREKAEQGVYPSRPPLGYANNKLEHSILVNEVKAPIARRMFQLFATGQYSLTGLRVQLKAEFGTNLAKSYLARLLKNPFYIGQFYWEKKLYSGTHRALVSRATFDCVQKVFANHNKPKYRAHEFAYRGLLTCAYDECKVTAETKKGKYTYYHCTQFRGKCALPYFREEELGNRLGQILRDIHIPGDILEQLQKSLLATGNQDDQNRKERIVGLKQKIAAVLRRMDLAYQDKLDGTITEEFWSRKSGEWQAELEQLRVSVESLEGENHNGILKGLNILELAHKAHSLYLKQTPSERAELLKTVLSNCAIDAVSLYPTYRKPFDLIFKRVKTEEWCARGDSNSRPLASEASALSS